MGRTRKPTAQKKVEGTYRKDRAVENEMEAPLVSGGVAKQSDFINKYAFDEWNRIFTTLGDIGLLMVTDITALMMLCNNVGIYMDCVDKLKDGLTTITPNGHEQQRPEVNTMVKMQEQYFKGCAKFGLTPTDRMAISMPDKKPKDIADEF